MQVLAIQFAHERADIRELRPPPIRICHVPAPTRNPLERLRTRAESRLYPSQIKMRGFVSLYGAFACQALFNARILSTSAEPRGSPPWCAVTSRYDLVFGWIREGSTP